MFLLERLIGVGTYALILVLACVSLVGKSNKIIRRILFIYTVVLSIMAFFYVPYETADLHRINEYIEAYKKYSASQMWNLVAKSKFRLADLLYWAIGKTSIPRLLPAIVTFVCYTCIFYIVRKTAEKNQISGKNVAIALFFYMSLGTYIFAISGIRSMLGISLLCFCFFRESVEKKFNILHIPLYIIAALIHPFVAVLAAGRFFAAVFDTQTTSGRKLLYLVLLGTGTAFTFRNYSDFIDSIVEKANSYLTGDLYSYVWDYIIAIITCLVIFSIILGAKKIEKQSSLKFNVFRTYLSAGLLTAVCLCYEFSIFHRTAVYVLPIIGMPLLLTILQRKDDLRREVVNRSNRLIPNGALTYHSMIVILSVVLLLLSCSRGSLCSFKFFVLSNT